MSENLSLRVIPSGTAAAAVANTMEDLVSNKVASRIAAKDFTLWGQAAEAESAIRLGWVSSAFDSVELIPKILKLRDEFTSKGITRFVLCGMGGSSLAPEVITATHGVELVVLDSTNSDQVRAALIGDLAKTAVIISSKSGATVETDSQKRIFEKAFDDLGIDKTDRIVVVTDPGSPMEIAAKSDGYRVFNADPTVGGRYSALTAFGLVPTGLAGANIELLLREAQEVAELLGTDSPDNPALILGAAMARTPGEMGLRDKVGIVSDGSPIIGFGEWAEQLIAESTGKLGKGILPLVLEPQSPELRSGLADLIPIHIQAEAKPVSGDAVSVSGTLGAQILLWEYATVIACRLLGVNPFDQPDVESAKIASRGMLAERAAALPEIFSTHGIQVRASGIKIEPDSIQGALASLFSKLDDDEGYVSIQAYLDRTSVPEAMELRDLISKLVKRPVTFGWAPRFLHSTGQYHKGGPTQGVYLQILAASKNDLAIPGRDFTFGELITSQAAGDAKVLSDLGRPVLTLTLDDSKLGVAEIKNAIQGQTL